MHALGDERHMVFECPAMQPVRDRFPGLFAANIDTMQRFMWQPDLRGVAHFVLACFDSMRDPDTDDDADSDASGSSNQP